MPATTSSLLEDLTGAIAVSTAALEEGATFKQRRSAMRTLHRALARVAELDELWTELTARAVGVSPESELDDALLESVADAFNARYAVLLAAAGYKTPPPPPGHVLLASTLTAITDPAGTPLERIERAREGLREFVLGFAENLAENRARSQTRWLSGGRVTAAASAALVLATGVQVTTGNEFDVNLGFSIRDKVSIEITVPKPWDQADAVAGRIAWGVADHVQQGTETALAQLQRDVPPSFRTESVSEEFDPEPEFGSQEPIRRQEDGRKGRDEPRRHPRRGK